MVSLQDCSCLYTYIMWRIFLQFDHQWNTYILHTYLLYTVVAFMCMYIIICRCLVSSHLVSWNKSINAQWQQLAHATVVQYAATIYMSTLIFLDVRTCTCASCRFHKFYMPRFVVASHSHRILDIRVYLCLNFCDWNFNSSMAANLWKLQSIAHCVCKSVCMCTVHFHIMRMGEVNAKLFMMNQLAI